MRIFIAFVSFLMGSGYAFAQATLSGKVVSDSGQPLAGCHVHVDGKYSVTDANGLYSMSIVPDIYTVTVSFVGFRTVERRADISADTQLDFILSPDLTKLSEVTVNSGKSNSAVVSRTSLTATEIEKYSNATLGDAVREVSGVSSLKTGSTIVKPVINGLHSSRVLVINNNVRLEDQQWGLEHAPNLDVNTAGKISVVKGAGALQYGGDAIGGVIIVEPSKIPIKDTLYGRTILNLATNGRGGSLSTSLNKGYASGWHWNAQGTFKYLGDLDAPEYTLSNTGTRERDFSTGGGFRGDHSGFEAFYSYYNAKIGILRASHIGNVTDLVNAINNGQPFVTDPFTYDIDAPKQQVQHHLLKLHYYSDWHSGRLDVQYAAQFNNRKEFDIRRGNNRNRPALDMDLFTQSVNLDYASDAAQALRFKSGVSVSFQQNNAKTDTGIRPLIPDYTKWDAGVYTTVTWNALEKWHLESGIRYDFSHVDAVKFYYKSRWEQQGYDDDFGQFITGDFGSQWKTNPVFSYHNISAALGSRYALSDATDWIVNLSLARRNPNPSELFSDGLHHATGQIELGDLRLQQETSWKASTAIVVSDERFRLEVNPYLNYIRNFIYPAPTALEYTIRGAFPVWEYNSTNARLAGVDVTADWDLTKHFHYRSLFAYVNGEDLQYNQPIIDIPSMNWSNAITFSKKEWHSLVVGLRSEWVFFQDRYPNNDFTADVLIDGNLVSTLVQISRPPKAYHLLHFTSEMELPLFKKARSFVTFGIQNLFDTAYRDYLNRMRFYADDIGRNFTLQFKINF
ncbi:MAG TPA: TonB-dependent receptor [Flavobacterium sp.]|nr:TonB-dependent receptor [Flavobacterium sp.]